jgi:Fe-S-cluster containining protein
MQEREERMIKFECSRCGACCRNLLMQMGRWQLGLMLLPPERKLFPDNLVAPMWATGRNKPENIAAYQLNAIDCVHLKGNSCNIYEKRPKICRAFPLTIEIQNGNVVGATLSGNCPQSKELINTRAKLLESFPEEMIAANIDRYEFNSQHLRDELFMFDLKSKAWSKMTYADAITVNKQAYPNHH